MFSLLLLSMALSAPATATPVSAVAVNPGQLDSSDLVQMQFGSPEPRTEERAQGADSMAIHPDPSVCYKIRAYIFSEGHNPKLLRETTCGPKAANSRQTDGFQLVPTSQKTKPDIAPQE